MSIDEIIKLNMRLGDKYFIVPGIKDTWTLIRNNKLGQIVMDSEHNTEEELKKFVKEHRVFNLSKVWSTTSLIINTLIFVLCIVNIFINSSFLRGFNLGALMVITIMLLVRSIVDEHNWKIEDKIANEDIETLRKFQKKVEKICLEGEKSNKKTKGLMSDLKKNEIKPKTIKTKIGTIKGENTTITRKKVSSTKTSTKKPRTKVEEKKDV